MTDLALQARQRLVTDLELQRIGLARAQAVFAATIARGPSPTYRQFGQGMCRPGWTADAWKGSERP